MRDPDHTYEAPIRSARGYYHDETPSWGDDFTPLTWAILALLLSCGIILVSVVVYAAVSHAIHPSCATVLACIRL